MEKQRDIEIYSPRSMAPKVTASLNLTCKKIFSLKQKNQILSVTIEKPKFFLLQTINSIIISNHAFKKTRYYRGDMQNKSH